MEINFCTYIENPFAAMTTTSSPTPSNPYILSEQSSPQTGRKVTVTILRSAVNARLILNIIESLAPRPHTLIRLVFGMMDLDPIANEFRGNLQLVGRARALGHLFSGNARMFFVLCNQPRNERFLSGIFQIQRV